MDVLYGLRDVALVIACGVIAMLGSHAGVVRQLTGVVGIAASASLAARHGISFLMANPVFGALTAGIDRLEPTLIVGLVVAFAGIHGLTWLLAKALGTFANNTLEHDDDTFEYYWWFNALGGGFIALVQIFMLFADFRSTGNCGSTNADGIDLLAGATAAVTTCAPFGRVIDPLVSLLG